MSWVGGNEIKANSAQLELELGISLCTKKRQHIANKDAMSFIKVLLSDNV